MTKRPLHIAEGTFGVRAQAFAKMSSTMQRCLPLRKQPKPAPAPDSPDIAKLAEVVQGLTHQVRQLALILDEVREDVVWAVRNDKIHGVGHSQHYVASHLQPLPNPKVDDDEATNPPPHQPPAPVAKPTKTLFE